VVLDLVVFDDPSITGLRAGIEAGEVVILASRECLDELRRVLAYPGFGLDAARQAAALEWFATRVELSDPVRVGAFLPRCSDRDDQKFLELAWAGKADRLVTKDKALLALRRRVAKLGRFLVSSPTELTGAKD
jgi:uncharacterized protein